MAGVARRDAGTGGLYQDARGYWNAAVTLPDRDGKRRRKVIRRKRKADAVAALRALRVELDRTGDLPTSSPTLASWMTLWLDTIAAPRLKPRTLETYHGYVDRYIVPTLGKVALDRLSAQHVRRLHADMTAKGLSSTTALQAHRILAKALTDAEREGRVNRNVATLLDAPRKAAAVRPALSAGDATRLLVHVADDPALAVHWSVALLAGLRQGERLGLTREMVDLDTGTITVAWQLQRLRWQHGCTPRCGNRRGTDCPDRTVPIPPDQEARPVYGGLWLTRPKSKAGWREVPIAPPLDEILERHLATTDLGDEGLIFHRGDGHPIDPSDDSAAWDASLRVAGVPDVPLHSARHTCSTLLFELGVPEQIRMQILGHSSATVTRGYTKVTDPLARDAMSRLGQLIRPQIQA